MKPTSSFLNLPQSGIRRMYDLAKNKKDTVSFVLGEPDFVTPKHIIEAAKKKLDEGCTHYTDNAGILPLRQEISAPSLWKNEIRISQAARGSRADRTHPAWQTPLSCPL